jgi:hypothetical protein
MVFAMTSRGQPLFMVVVSRKVRRNRWIGVLVKPDGSAAIFAASITFLMRGMVLAYTSVIAAGVARFSREACEPLYFHLKQPEVTGSREVSCDTI